jgi:pimeloyl-ACP methyl ester carboxylesterase
MDEGEPIRIDVEGAAIAVRHRPGRTPGIVWLGGYRSDMRGTKAEALDAWATESGHAVTRHDYSGHGESGGAFEEGTISRWLAESLAVFRRFTEGPQILVGSSMGAWVALRMVQENGWRACCCSRPHPISRRSSWSRR